jgi:mRNA-degrading endonuclease toxin of MazEF toxin-antitoxin module
VAALGANFSRDGYVPLLGDVVHLNWSPTVGHEMAGPHYGLVVSAYLFNHATGTAVVAPITSQGGKVSGFELPLRAGRVSGVAVLSSLRALDYQGRDVQYAAQADAALVTEANRRIRMIFP